MWSFTLAGFASVTNIIITRTFFQTSIPPEMREAASLEGCSNTRFLVKIALPLSKPIIAVMALYYGVDHWNSFFPQMIYLSDRNKYPLQLILREIVLFTSMATELSLGDAADVAKKMQLAELVKYGIIIVASLPALVIYPFIQKYFVKGVMIGSVKG
jgi:putative aldouronate transport system permease protein